MTSFRLTLWKAVAMVGIAAGSAAAQEAVIDPPGRVARLSYVQGEVSIAPAGTDEWAEAVLNRPLTSGDRVWADADARAELQIGSSTVHLDRQTGFGFIQLDDDVMQMSLTDGTATVRVRRLSERETIQVETPNATISLRHPGEYHFEVDTAGDRTIVKTRSGEADVVGDGKSYTVDADEVGVFSGLDDLQAQIGPIAPRTSFEAWANDRDRREQRSVSSRYVSRDVIGYEDLDDYGEWVHEREYGYVWRPLYVASDWAPYRYGRWAWVSPWGWTWVDDARWGFAPFHYGRWAYARHRWCWVPGPRRLRPVYAPALVGWIGGPSLSVSISFGSGVGWFPLGPHEVYVPGYLHTPRYIRHVNVSNTIIVNNTYINNIYRGRGGEPIDYHHRRHPHAVTAVGREHFVGGRPIGDRRHRIDDGELRQWRDERRPPAIAPYRESVLAGQPRGRGGGASSERNDALITNRGLITSRGLPGRVAFEAERRAIEANGGRPVGRSQLFDDNPKRGRGDFRASNTRGEASNIKSTERAMRNGRDVTPRDRPVAHDERRDANGNERVEVLRGGNSEPQNQPRRDRRVTPTPVETRPSDSTSEAAADARANSHRDRDTRSAWRSDRRPPREDRSIENQARALAPDLRDRSSERRSDHWVRPPSVQAPPQNQAAREERSRSTQGWSSQHGQHAGESRSHSGDSRSHSGESRSRSDEPRSSSRSHGDSSRYRQY